MILTLKEKMTNSDIAKGNSQNTKYYKQMLNEHSNEMNENTAFIYSSMMNYFGKHLGEDNHKNTETKILKKCLTKSKINFPDLFLRFLD